MAETVESTLISTKPSESILTVSLHPLVLLTASDLITRHRLRQEEGPLAGIILGQQTGHETTAEYAFAGKLARTDNGWVFDQEWTEQRIQQFKDVHKAPPLDAVGWFTTCPASGPLSEHVGLQKQVTNTFSEGGIFLAIHPSSLAPSDTTNRKLPISIYESIAEGDRVQDDGSMQIDGEDNTGLKFRPLPYTIDTNETEMIAIDYVAKGAGSAAAVDGAARSTPSQQTNTDDKGKQKAGAKITDQKQSSATEGKSGLLTVEEEDQIAGITTRLNSVKMLQTRLELLTKFVKSLPPSYLSDPNLPLSEDSPDSRQLPHLRSIQALLTRLSRLTPAQNPQQPVTALQQATLSQNNDVALISMLSQLGQDVQDLSELGRKFGTIETNKIAKGKGKGGFNQASLAGTDDHDGKIGGLTLNSGMLI